jgi:hypothetical protein
MQFVFKFRILSKQDPRRKDIPNCVFFRITTEMKGFWKISFDHSPIRGNLNSGQSRNLQKGVGRVFGLLRRVNISREIISRSVERSSIWAPFRYFLTKSEVPAALLTECLIWIISFFYFPTCSSSFHFFRTLLISFLSDWIWGINNIRQYWVLIPEEK